MADIQESWVEAMNKRKKYNLGEVTNPQIEKCINDWVHNSVHREMLKYIFIDGLTNQEVAEKYGYCENSIKYIIKTYHSVLIDHIQDY